MHSCCSSWLSFACEEACKKERFLQRNAKANIQYIMWYSRLRFETSLHIPHKDRVACCKPPLSKQMAIHFRHKM